MQIYPVKLVPGYIAVDFVVGCINCNFCVAKRDSLIKDYFEAGTRYSICGGKSVYELLKKMPSFTEAKIPLRIGNDTDFVFQKSQTKELINYLPHDYPIVVLTRFPLSDCDISFFNDRNNILLKITITPNSKTLFPRQDINKVVKSIEKLRSKIVITFGPITNDNISNCKRIINDIRFPSRAYIYLKPLDYDGLPWLKNIQAASVNSLQEIKEQIKKRHLRHLTMILCPLLETYNRADPRVVDIPLDEKVHCTKCLSYALCYEDTQIDHEILLSSLQTIGINKYNTIQKVGFKSHIIDLDIETSIGDESFVSYILGRKIRFSQTIKPLISRAIIGRWRKVDFYPIDEINALIKI